MTRTSHQGAQVEGTRLTVEVCVWVDVCGGETENVCLLAPKDKDLIESCGLLCCNVVCGL